MIDVKDKEGNTPLDLAVKGNMFNVVNYLTEKEGMPLVYAVFCYIYIWIH